MRGRAPNRGPTAGVRGPRVPSARGHRAPSGGCRGAQRPLAARRSAAAVTARPGTDWGHLQPLPPVFNSPSGRRRGAGGSTQSSPPRAPPRGLQLVRGRCGRRLLLPPSLSRHLPAAPCGRSASVRGRGRGRDGAGSAAAGAQLPRPRAAGAAPGRAARQPRLPRAAATAGDSPRVAPRGSVPLAGCVVRGWGVLGES